MTLAIVDEPRLVTGGVDTHADARVAAALDGIGGLLGVQEFPATPAGYARLLAWLAGFGTVHLVGAGGTGRTGAGLARHITAAGIRVAGAGRADAILMMRIIDAKIRVPAREHASASKSRTPVEVE